MPPDDDLLQSLPHSQLEWNTPLSARRADRLLSSLRPVLGSRFLDLGCGWGGLLLRALSATAGTRGTGVDQNRAYLDRAARAARQRGLAGRVRFVRGDITHVRARGNCVLCVGSNHAWANEGAALSRIRARVIPGGRLLFGCGIWNRPAGRELLDIFGDLPGSLGVLRALARSSGWKVRAAECADLDEWDEFEATWRQDLEEIAAREPGTALGRRASRLSDRRRREFEHGYRGTLGFAYLVLERNGT